MTFFKTAFLLALNFLQSGSEDSRKCLIPTLPQLNYKVVNCSSDHRITDERKLESNNYCVNFFCNEGFILSDLRINNIARCVNGSWTSKISPCIAVAPSWQWRQGRLPRSLSPQDNPTSRFIGCYKDSIEVRLMSGDNKDFRGTLTPDICITHCKTKGFAYAGLQYAYECFCSHEKPSFKRFAEFSDCNTVCDGDRREICGGNNRLSVYDIHSNERMKNYMGCFSKSRRAQKKITSPYKKAMTPEFCVGYCYIHGYRYAGVQYPKQCFCGDDIKSEDQKVSEEKCKEECADGKQCGEAWSIYHTSISNEQEDNRLIGCYEDSEESRLLSGEELDLIETNSPRRCLNICLQLGFKYAGVEYGTECFCGNKRPDKSREAAESECLAQCPKSQLRACGGNWRMAIYSTDPFLSEQREDDREDDRLLGCYKDSLESRLLSGQELNLNENNTPRRCVNVCHQAGFKYAGLEYGIQCFCGNNKPDPSKETAESECLVQCPKSELSACGGNWRMAIYSTDPLPPVYRCDKRTCEIPTLPNMNYKVIDCGSHKRITDLRKISCNYCVELYCNEGFILSDFAIKYISKCVDGTWTPKIPACIACGLKQEDEPAKFLIHNPTRQNTIPEPWFANLYSNGKYQCGGTIAHSRAVVTAAHCLKKVDKDEYTLIDRSDIKDLRIAVGKLYSNFAKTEESQQILEVEDVRVPLEGERYGLAYQSDIAIIITKEHIKFSPNVKPACIDQSKEVHVAGLPGKVVGFGNTENHLLSEVLLSADFTICCDIESCKERVLPSNTKLIRPDKFCVTPYNGTKLDQGDSGGGFIVIRNKRNYLFGIVSLQITDTSECACSDEEVEPSVIVKPDNEFPLTCSPITIALNQNVTIKALSKENLDEILKGSNDSSIQKAEDSNSDLLPGIYEGGLKIWECTYDLCGYLLREKLSFEGKSVLDLGCGAGILGILAKKLGSRSVGFHDYNHGVIKNLTIPNVWLNYPSVENFEFWSGDWSGFKPRDLYNVILTSETIYNPSNYTKLHKAFQACLQTDGVIYLAAKSYYFGVGGSISGFCDFVEKKKIFNFKEVYCSQEGVKRMILELKLRESYSS